MASARKNRAIYIDKEALSALALVQEGLLSPADGLMDEKEAAEVDLSGEYMGRTLPFSFILAPSGNRNQKILPSLKKGEQVDLICDSKKVGEIETRSVFAIDPTKRVERIFGTNDTSHPGVSKTLKRLGSYAISGKYRVEFDDVKKGKERIKEAKERINSSQTTAMMIAAKPLHRAHERMIRLALDKCDLLVIFLLKPYQKDFLDFEVRLKTLNYLVDNFLPKNRVVVIPFENNYLFAGNNEMILDAIVAQNYGCNRLVTGQTHVGLGMFYEDDGVHSIFDMLKGVNIEIDIASEYVYCNLCKTLVSTKTCAHGQHHHISYHSNSIMELLKTGLLPPAVLVRKEISAIILSALFPNRFKNLEKLYYDIMPVSGLLESHNEEEFYLELMNLYQTTSLS